MSRRTRARNAFETTISGSITDSSSTIACTSLTGLDDPCYLVLEPDIPAKREFIKAAVISGSNLQSVTRGLDGSTAGAQAHDAGAVVRSIPVHQQLDDMFTDVEDLETDVTSHVGVGGSQHAAATTGLAGFMSSADKTKIDTLLTGGTVTGGNAHDHVGGDGAQIAHSTLSGLTAGDDHTMYLKEKASGGTAAEIPEHTHASAAAGGVLTQAAVFNLVWPVGSVFTAVVSTNPATLLGGGTWAAFGAGKVLVSRDAADPDFDTVEETGGNKVTSLVTANLPSHAHTMAHTHQIDPPATASGNQSANHDHSIPASSRPDSSTSHGHVDESRLASASNAAGTDFTYNGAGTNSVSHTHTTNIAEFASEASSAANTGNAGSGTDISRVQPYIVVYMWKRTA